MAQRSVLCTVQDVRNLDEYTSSFVIDDARVMQCILRADAVLRNTLRPLYADVALLESAPWNGPPQPPFAIPDQGITANDPDSTGRLVDVTLGPAAITEQLTVTFTAADEFTVSGSLSGAFEDGTTTEDYDSGYLSIPTTCWDGTFTDGDRWYVAVYTAKPMIVTVEAMLAASMMMKAIYHSQDGKGKGDALYVQAMDLIERLTRPYEDGGIQLDSFSPRDISPEGIAHNIDFLGRDLTRYAANAMTNDPGTMGLPNFFAGPVWLQ